MSDIADKLFELHYELLPEQEAELLRVRMESDLQITEKFEKVKKISSLFSEAVKIAPPESFSVQVPGRVFEKLESENLDDKDDEKKTISPPPERPEEISDILTSVAIQQLSSTSVSLRPLSGFEPLKRDSSPDSGEHTFFSHARHRSLWNPFASHFSGKYRRINRIITICSTALLLLALGGFFQIQWNRSSIVQNLIRIKTVVPSVLARDSQNSLQVDVSDILGRPRKTSVSVSFLGEMGERIITYKESTDSSGKLGLALDAPENLPDQVLLEITAGESDRSRTLRTYIPVIDAPPECEYPLSFSVSENLPEEESDFLTDFSHPKELSFSSRNSHSIAAQSPSILLGPSPQKPGKIAAPPGTADRTLASSLGSPVRRERAKQDQDFQTQPSSLHVPEESGLTARAVPKESESHNPTVPSRRKGAIATGSSEGAKGPYSAHTDAMFMGGGGSGDIQSRFSVRDDLRKEDRFPKDAAFAFHEIMEEPYCVPLHSGDSSMESGVLDSTTDAFEHPPGARAKRSMHESNVNPGSVDSFSGPQSLQGMRGAAQEEIAPTRHLPIPEVKILPDPRDFDPEEPVRVRVQSPGKDTALIAVLSRSGIPVAQVPVQSSSTAVEVKFPENHSQFGFMQVSIFDPGSESSGEVARENVFRRSARHLKIEVPEISDLNPIIAEKGDSDPKTPSDSFKYRPFSVKISDEQGFPVSARVRLSLWEETAGNFSTTFSPVLLDNSRDIHAEFSRKISEKKPLYEDWSTMIALLGIVGGLFVSVLVLVLFFCKMISGYSSLFSSVFTGILCIILGVSLMHNPEVSIFPDREVAFHPFSETDVPVEGESKMGTPEEKEGAIPTPAQMMSRVLGEIDGTSDSRGVFVLEIDRVLALLQHASREKPLFLCIEALDEQERIGFTAIELRPDSQEIRGDPESPAFFKAR